jgi:hypothetical protein
MRKLIASTFASLDGIMQAPGGPEEDPTGGFALGGWMFGYGDESMDVASRTLTTLHWNNSTLLHGDVVSAIIAPKAQPGPDLQMIGSGNLIQTLQAASLIDEYKRVDFSSGAWAGEAPLQRDCQAIGAAARSLAGFDLRRCDEYLCTRRRYPARFVREYRAK